MVIGFINKQLNLRGFMAGLRTDWTATQAIRFILCFIVSLFTVLQLHTAPPPLSPCLVTAADWLVGTNGRIKIHGNHREAFIGIL